jgi:apolipoprotein D and lipocalin family protein
MKLSFVLLLAIFLTGCLGMPEKVEPVKEFELNRYLGNWYEIARLDHSFERGLEKVTAEYSLREDGGVKVVNRGYSPEKGKWKEAEGEASFVDSKTEGYLKVSFFGPFYSSYVIFDLDKENYEYSFISGKDNDYLWLLARQPNVPQEVIERFKAKSAELGFKTEDLIFVKHD